LRKEDGTRARRNKDVIPLTVVHQVEAAEQPLLPADIEWHPQVITWWHTWRESPLSDNFTTTDWQYLLETAFIQNAFWNGSLDRAGELRLRAAKFGATPEDRARLRIQVVTADEVEAKAEARSNTPSSRGRYQAPQAG
jgi:hypothetical protein